MQSKKLTHGYLKTHSKERMAKYDPENAQAWAVIMDKIRQEYATGSTQLSIAKKLGVTKVAVSRWLSEDRGGERTTFGDMLRYAKALNIPFAELVREPSEKPTQKADVTPYDKAVGSILEEFATDSGLTADDIFQKTNILATTIHSIFTGETAITASMLYSICSALEVGATMVLNRAARQIEKKP